MTSQTSVRESRTNEREHTHILNDPSPSNIHTHIHTPRERERERERAKNTLQSDNYNCIGLSAT